jgi:Ubiquitin family
VFIGLGNIACRDRANVCMFLVPSAAPDAWVSSRGYIRTCLAIGVLRGAVGELDDMAWPNQPATNCWIYVKTLTGKMMRPRVDTRWPVMWLMWCIQKAEDFPPEYQRLIYNGRQLSEDRLLSDYGIRNDDTVDLVLRMRGD